MVCDTDEHRAFCAVGEVHLSLVVPGAECFVTIVEQSALCALRGVVPFFPLGVLHGFRV